MFGPTLPIPSIIFRRMLTLCSVITRRAWLDVMYSAMDATKEGFQPVRDASPQNALFVLLLSHAQNIRGIIVGTFRQFSWLCSLRTNYLARNKRMMRRVRTKRPPPASCARRIAHNIVGNRFFEGLLHAASSCTLYLCHTKPITT